ncbi:protoporphyrinogen/coproporphyrinogen oxidase [Roseibium litorale]|uniref:NAD(P)-binding protein n=1 Tax=Roseibium litorale TaxID=2803841 RepID=A0ABR9CNP7_9HYPH|nr:NAD(P)-binding protein [Roseibium litorale]MBD8892470.1 NAD(P)-binding protein [Roseibium litorale]
MGKIAIIGAGISGAACARRLKELGHEAIIFEKNKIPGGLVKCTIEDGNLFHRVGGHVFNSKDKNISEWFWSNFKKDQEFLFANRNAAIHFKDRFVGYPIEQNLYEMNQDDVSLIVSDLLRLNKSPDQVNFEEESFYDFLQRRFGPILCESYFIPYNEKIWNTDLKSMPVSWLAGKLPMPTVEEILTANIKRQTETKMVHSQFYYPKEGGSQFIIDRLLSGIEIHTGNECRSIEVNGSLKIGLEGFDAVIFTGDIREIGSLLGSSDRVFDPLRHLKSNGTTTVLCSCDANPYSWLYIPNPNIKCHRMIMTGNFSPANNSDDIGRNRTTCTIEFVGEVNQALINASLAMLPLRPEQISVNYEPKSYVIQDKNTRQAIDNVRAELRSKKIWLCGRFAEWEYYNMDAAIESAFRATREINEVL